MKVDPGSFATGMLLMGFIVSVFINMYQADRIEELKKKYEQTSK